MLKLKESEFVVIVKAMIRVFSTLVDLLLMFSWKRGFQQLSSISMGKITIIDVHNMYILCSDLKSSWKTSFLHLFHETFMKYHQSIIAMRLPFMSVNKHSLSMKENSFFNMKYLKLGLFISFFFVFKFAKKDP